MKKLFVTLLFSLAGSAVFSQTVLLNPVVDERTELMSIVFRLAESPEYMNSDIKNYTNSIDDYFKGYKNDDLIKFIRKIRKRSSVSFDAVMSMAVNLKLSDGTLSLINNISKTSLDDRWGNNSEKFVSLLNDFYRKSDFSRFYVEHKPLYAIAEKRFSVVVQTIDLNWFESFFGKKPEGEYNLIISLANGGCNYGPKVIYKNGREDLYSIIGSWETDSLGLPVYSNDISETIIHEFCHSFCNQLGISNYPKMKTVADRFFNLVQENMRKQAYSNSLTMLNEILVRASVIEYFHDHHASQVKINNLLGAEQSSGFIWIDTLVGAFGKYEKLREDYPTLEKYMPEIVKLQNSLSPDEQQKASEAKRPQLILFSIGKNSTDVDPATRELILTFDRPMMTRPYGMNKGKCGDKCWPKIISVKWNPEKNNELVISWEILPDHHYSMIFPARFFMDEHGFLMRETCYLDFKTKR